MSYGNCVLVSDIEENAEAVGSAGYRVRSVDVGDLQQKLRFLIQSPQSVEDARERSRARVHKLYDWEHVPDEYEALYRSLLSR